MRIRLLLFIISLLLFADRSVGQIVGGNVFLQGHWIEAGIDNMGALGTCSSPVTYHPHVCCSGIAGTFTPGGELDVTYDPGHDGWSVGSPALMGDYTIPGFPQEGWGMQVGATEYRNWASGGACTGPFNIPGTITGYSNSGGIITGTWTGNIAGLHIVQESRIDTEGSAVIVTVHLYNTTAATISGIYYERTCDPDNASFWGGGSTTHNRIVHQNEDARHEVLVSSVADLPFGTYNLMTYLALGTKDCRAVASIFANLTNDFGLTPGYTPAQLWAKTIVPNAYSYALGDSDYMDAGIALVFNVGNLTAAGTPGDSTVLSYAYFYNHNDGIDSAFPDPQMVVNGSLVPNSPQPYPTYDTFFACSAPGATFIPVDILHATDKDWTWSKWTWAPATGLTSTTGVVDTVALNLLSGPITYTITGTDSAMGNVSCNHRIFYLTIVPCHTAFNNYPCEGDTLRLGDRGDSVGATYFWYGPGGFTSGVQNPYRYPATLAETGLYYVVRTRFGVSDSDSTYVFIHPKPILNITSNIPQCAPLVTPLTLSVLPDSVGETFLWSGPNGFTSTDQFPTITPFDSTGQGMYTVSAISQFGCTNMNSYGVWAGVVPGFTFETFPGCVFDTVIFHNTSHNANVYAWDFGDLSPINPDREVGMHLYSSGHKHYTVTLKVHNLHCPTDSPVTHDVNVEHSVHALFRATPDTICFEPGVTMPFFDSSWADEYDNVTPLGNNVWPGTSWFFDDGSSDTAYTPTPHQYNSPGIYNVRLLVRDGLGCIDSARESAYVVLINIHSLKDSTLCLSQPLQLFNTVTTIPPYINFNFQYAWTQSSPNLDDTTLQIPSLYKVGTFIDTMTATIPGIYPDACPARDTITIHSVLGVRLTNVTPSQTIPLGSSIQLNADSEVVYYWKPNDGSLNNPNISNPVATPQVGTLYTVYGLDKNGCLDSTSVMIYVDSSMAEGLPTGFTPNGDGLNDVFRLVGLKYQKLVEFRIFNRWGQEVFMTANPKQGWDGTFNGTPQDAGVYFYQVIVGRPGGSGDNIIYKGSVTLIR